MFWSPKQDFSPQIVFFSLGWNRTEFNLQVLVQPLTQKVFIYNFVFDATSSSVHSLQVHIVNVFMRGDPEGLTHSQDLAVTARLNVIELIGILALTSKPCPTITKTKISAWNSDIIVILFYNVVADISDWYIG